MDGLFNIRLQQALSNAGMSQKELAQKAGVTEAAISHYLKGDRLPRFAVAVTLAETLNVAVEGLMSGNTEMNFDEVYKIVARSAKQLDNNQKAALVKALFEDGKI